MIAVGSTRFEIRLPMLKEPAISIENANMARWPRASEEKFIGLTCLTARRPEIEADARARPRSRCEARPLRAIRNEASGTGVSAWRGAFASAAPLTREIDQMAGSFVFQSSTRVQRSCTHKYATVPQPQDSFKRRLEERCREFAFSGGRRSRGFCKLSCGTPHEVATCMASFGMVGPRPGHRSLDPDS